MSRNDKLSREFSLNTNFLFSFIVFERRWIEKTEQGRERKKERFQELGTPSRFAMWIKRTHHYHLPGASLAGSWTRSGVAKTNPGPLMWEVL